MKNSSDSLIKCQIHIRIFAQCIACGERKHVDTDVAQAAKYAKEYVYAITEYRIDVVRIQQPVGIREQMMCDHKKYGHTCDDGRFLFAIKYSIHNLDV